MFLVLCTVVSAKAADSAGISGRVMDTTGALVVGADVTATNLLTGVATHTVSDVDGAYSLNGLPAGRYKLVVSKGGFSTFRQDNLQLGNGQIVTTTVTMQITTVGSTVNVYSDLPGATAQPTQQDVFESNQSIRVLDRKQMDAAGPVAGAAQVVALTPGANVTGYGNTGATKYTVGINGVSQGWGGYGGYTGGGALAITFDGVPVVDPATNLWQSPTIPETFMIQNTNVTYGPGDPASRWYNNVGGMIEFTPVQPTSRPHADISATYGSFNQKDFAANLTSGIYHGWSGVLAAGVGSGDDFRTAPDGFKNPAKDVAVFSKGIKNYQDNTFEVGGYYAHGAGYRSQVIPIATNALITIDGQPGGKVYSQKDSGYYSTLPYASYNKYDTNEMGLVYGREHIHLDPTTNLENLSWYMHIARTHYRVNDVFQIGPQEREWNNPHTETIGDKLLLTKRIPFNTVTVGGYYLHALYNSRNNFYSPDFGGAKRIVNLGGKIRSSYFSQDDFAITVQDEIRLNSIVSITPGIRYVGFTTGFSTGAQQDFILAPTVVLSTACRYIAGTGSAGNANNQGACPDNRQNRSGVEPSVNATVRALPWLSLYGGFTEALRSPQVGGGGGLFQSVDPASYHLSRQTYYQAGFKIHQEGTGALNSMLLGAAYYHQNWAKQELDTTLSNGDTVSANGTSSYQGFNAYFDDDPIAKLHVFANMNVESAKYTDYVTVPAAGTVPALSFNGLPVPYVPNSTVNAGAYYDFKPEGFVRIQPMASFQYLGSQHIFDNNAQPQPIPSSRTMPGYGTLNLGLKVPARFLEFNVNALNVLNRKYSIYQYISSGGYFGTAGNGTPDQSSGYLLAYPGAPVSVYGGVVAHF